MALSKKIFTFVVAGVAALMVGVALAGCSSPSSDTTSGSSNSASSPAGYTIADGNIEGQVEVDGVYLSVQLDSNPTTGYTWSADVSGDGLELSGEEYTEAENEAEADEQTMVGVGGYDTFRFEGTAEGQQTVTLTYARANTMSADDKTVVIETHTDASGNIVSTETTNADGQVLGSTQM